MRTTTIRNDGANRAGGIVKAIRDERVASLRGLLGFGLALCAGALANSAWAVSVSLTAPSNSVIAAPATITLTATATPGAGRRILRVDFFQGTSRIGTDTSAPYGVTWSNVPRGNYILTATAIDSGGSVAVSNQVFVRVDTPPTVSLTSPVNNGVFAPGANIPLTANAADADEIVTKVEFFSERTLLGTQFLAPYNITWNNVPAGRYSLTARATDLVGLVTTSAPVTITVDAPPTVTITSPANNTLFVAPATVTVRATAADTDGSVILVEFFDGATPMGTVPTTPGSSTYSVTLANLATGTHTLTARAIDNLGATAISSAVTIMVNSAAAQIYYIHPDHLNTPRAVYDGQQNLVWRWDNQEPFGDSVPSGDPNSTGVVFDFRLRFEGQYADNETGTFYNIARDYSPEIGRYVESDPIGLAGGINTYAYVNNSPLRNSDPKGLATMCCRLLDHFLGGTILRQRHCYIVADDGHKYGLYPIVGIGVPIPDNPLDRKGSSGKCYDCPPTPCVDQNKCLRDTYNRYPIGPYNGLGQNRGDELGNSNTFAGTLARSCCKGGVPAGVYNAPGINPPADIGDF